MRSWLFVPADSERKLGKSLASGADALILDLEDSVQPAAKAEARALAADFLRSIDRSAPGPQIYVRVNALDTGLTEQDLQAIMPARPDGLMLPKCSSGAMAKTFAAAVREREVEIGTMAGTIGLAVIATETAASLFAMGTYAISDVRLTAMTWGAEDLSADLQTSHVRNDDGTYADPFALARTLTLLAARAADTEPVDSVYPAFRDNDGLVRDCAAAARDGFTGKLAIHPGQIEAINAAFTPSAEALDRARAIVAAFSADPEAGVISLEGEMLDRPHRLRAERLLKRAERFSS